MTGQQLLESKIDELEDMFKKDKATKK